MEGLECFIEAKMAQRCSKMAKRRPKMAPGRSQDGQIWLEDALKTRSDASKMVENSRSVEIHKNIEKKLEFKFFMRELGGGGGGGVIEVKMRARWPKM